MVQNRRQSSWMKDSVARSMAGASQQQSGHPGGSGSLLCCLGRAMGEGDWRVGVGHIAVFSVWVVQDDVEGAVLEGKDPKF